MLTTVVNVAVFYAAISYFFWSFSNRGKDIGIPPNHVFFEFLNNQQIQMNWVFLITTFVALAIIAVIGYVVSHRVAGPLHRLIKHFQDVADGKTLQDVTFRSNDYFSEVAENYNKQLVFLRSKIETVNRKDSQKSENKS